MLKSQYPTLNYTRKIINIIFSGDVIRCIDDSALIFLFLYVHLYYSVCINHFQRSPAAAIHTHADSIVFSSKVNENKEKEKNRDKRK